MRELKFRVWDIASECYLSVTRSNDDGVLGITIDGTGIIYMEDGEVNVQLAGDSGVIIEQGTGLKDRNNKEIYEGDIVKRVCQKGYGYKPGEEDKIIEYPVDVCPVAVEWDNGGCGWSYFLNGCGLCRKMGWAAPDEVVVVGNIHENLELLGGKE